MTLPAYLIPRWQGEHINVRFSQHPSGWWDALITVEGIGINQSEEIGKVSAKTATKAWEIVTETVMGRNKE